MEIPIIGRNPRRYWGCANSIFAIPQTCALVSCIRNFEAALRIHVAARRASLVFCLRFAAGVGGDSSSRTAPLHRSGVAASLGSALTSAAAPRTRSSIHSHAHGRTAKAGGIASRLPARRSREGFTRHHAGGRC
jgi:hypothetical protein